MSYRKSNNYNNGGGRRKISLGAIVAIMLAGVVLTSALTAGLGFASKSFIEKDLGAWFQRELNEDNLVKADDYVNIIEETDKGLKINVKDDGSIYLTGCQDEKAEDPADQYHDVKIVDVTVEPGKYVLSSGNEKADKDTFGIQYDYIDTNDAKQTGWVFGESKVLEFTETTTVTLSIAVVRGERFFGIMSYLRPVLVPEGTANTDFYK